MSGLALSGKPTGLSSAALGLYAAYLVTPILLILVGSVGGKWSNTLLPVGVTERWYVELITNSTFVKAFWTSLWVCVATVIVSALIGLPLA